MRSSQEGSVFQTGTIGSLMHSVYEGDVSLESLAKQGNFGIGTYDKLAGELLLYEGTFYQIQKKGSVSSPSLKSKTPFAAVTFFLSQNISQWKSKASFQALQKHIDSLIPSKNLIYALQINADFDSITLRTVKEQEAPYSGKKALEDQYQYSQKSIRGTLIGFRFPQYLEQVNVPGYHFHFIDSSKKIGGHVFDASLHTATIQICPIYHFHLQLIKSPLFYAANLTRSSKKKIEKLERGL
ncbi:MAG: acetolactate decarboxylase [Parachlamydiales bacterium]|nr:acetolactate decarboxylase [Parachlamydiales bacterium]